MTLKTRIIERSLLKKGFAKDYGDHKFFTFVYNGEKSEISTKISHSHNEIDDFLISKMAKQIQVDKTFFTDFVECTKSEADYIQALKDKSLI